MNLPLVRKFVDERFLTHRLRSTSLAGIVGGVLAILLFTYRFYANHVWNWDLFTVAVAIVSVKIAAMAWYCLTD
jgi:hypothetical protein